MIGASLTALLGHGVFVKEVFSHPVLRGSHTAQVGDPVCQLFDGLHLLIQIMCFYEVTHLWGGRWGQNVASYYKVRPRTQILYSVLASHCFSHEGHCVQPQFSADPAGIGLRSSPAAGHTPEPPGRCPTRLYQVSDTNNSRQYNSDPSEAETFNKRQPLTPIRRVGRKLCTVLLADKNKQYSLPPHQKRFFNSLARAYPDVLQKDSASAVVLQTHQLLCMLALLFGLCAKELGKIW